MRARIDVRVEAVTHRRHEKRRLEQRKIQIGTPSFVQRGEHSNRRKGAATHVGHGIRGARRGLQPLARKSEAARRGDVVHVVPRPLAPRAGLAVARDRAIDDVRVVGLQPLVIDAEASCDAGTKALDDDVRLLHQLFNDVPGRGRFQVEGQASFVAILGIELHRDVGAPGIAARRLDLDHLGAEVGEDRRGERPRHEHREIHHPYAAQRQPGLSGHAFRDKAASRRPGPWRARW